MSFVAPFIADRFSSTVSFYREHRLRYPLRLIEEVKRCSSLPDGGRVLDLGCGPGFLAIAFALTGHSVLGIDPDEAMLGGAHEEAEAVGARVEFRQGSSYDLSPALGTFDLVTMGRSFHWMDRPATLRALEELVRPGGAIALFGDDHEKTRENGWKDVVKAATEEFAPAGAFSHRRRDGGWDGHVALLLDSSFCDVERYGVWERRTLTLAEIIGRGLSMSGTAPDALGERRAAFEAALTTRLSALSPEGRFTEVVEYYAVIARRA